MAENRYRLEFVVKAKDWQDVVDVFKNELGIESGKQDASDRKINGFFIVQIWINADKLGSDFYKKINESERIALSYDPSAKKIRDDILDRVCIIEHDLRKLLLHISDVVEDYFKIYDKTTVAKVYKNNREVVRKGDVNPITSYLTLEDEINIFSIDLSPWNNKPLTANDLLEIFDSTDAISKVREELRSKTESHTIWDTVNKYIIKKDKSWVDVLPKLNELKDIRNKAAHFRVVTKSDLDRVKSLSNEIINTITPKRQSTAQDLSELQRSLDWQMKAISEIVLPTTETIKSMNESYMNNLKIIIDSAAASQRSFQSMSIHAPALASLVKSQGIAQSIIGNSTLNPSIIAAQKSALEAIQSIAKNANIAPPESAMAAIVRMKDIINRLDRKIDEGPSKDDSLNKDVKEGDGEPPELSKADKEKEDEK